MSIKTFGRYSSSLHSSSGRHPRYRDVNVVSTLNPKTSAIVAATSIQKFCIRGHNQNTWAWSTPVSRQSLQHLSCVLVCLLFCFGVIKNLMRFFQQKSLQTSELVVEDCVIQAFVHVSSVISMSSSFSQRSLIYLVVCPFNDDMPLYSLPINPFVLFEL